MDFASPSFIPGPPGVRSGAELVSSLPRVTSAGARRGVSGAGTVGSGAYPAGEQTLDVDQGQIETRDDHQRDQGRKEDAKAQGDGHRDQEAGLQRSLDGLQVYTNDASAFAAGKTVTIEATVYASTRPLFRGRQPDQPTVLRRRLGDQVEAYRQRRLEASGASQAVLISSLKTL